MNQKDGMDRDSFDAAMKLEYGRTIMEGDDVTLKEHDLVNVKSISPKGILVDCIEIGEYLPHITRKISGRTFSFYQFLIQFEGFNG